MGREDSKGAVLVDFHGLRAHANLVGSIFRIGANLFNEVWAFEESLDWSVVPGPKRRVVFEKTAGFWSLFDFFRLMRLFTTSSSSQFVAGAPIIWHFFILCFGWRNNTTILIHNEFLKIHRNNSLGCYVHRIVFRLYRAKGVRLVVMSEALKKQVVRYGYYDKHLLSVLLHPLPDPDPDIQFSPSGAVTLLGFLRPQKLKGVKEVIKGLVETRGCRIRILGRLDDENWLEGIIDHCSEVQVYQRPYSDAEEKRFLYKSAIRCLIFAPDKTYEFLTPGTVMDSVRFGCYCLAIDQKGLAEELIGPLAVTEISESADNPAKIIDDLRKARETLNRDQLKRIIKLL